MVGRNLMDHPQYLAWGLLPVPGIPLSRSARDLGHRRSLRRSVPRPACRLPGQSGQRSLECDRRRFGGDPHVTTLDFINGINFSGLNKKDFTQLARQQRAVWRRPAETLGNLISRQFRIAFAVEQNPDPNNRVTLSSFTDALDLPRPRIAYDISDYTKQGIVAAFRLKKLIFNKLGARTSPSLLKAIPPASRRRSTATSAAHLWRRRSHHGHLPDGQ